MVQQVLIKRTGVDNKPPTGLSPGELAVEMGNPSRLWVGVPTANDASGMKLLNNSAIKSAIAPVPATEGQLWFDGLTLYVHSAGVWVPINLTPPVYPQFNCYLTESAINNGPITLSREGGTYLFINGKNELIPSAAVTLLATGLTDVGGINGRRGYYIYAYMNGATMAMEATATLYATDITYGHKIKTGDPTRTLVGMAILYANGQWWPGRLGAVSWHNPKKKTYHGIVINQTGTSSTVPAELVPGSSIRFVSFGDREVTADLRYNNAYQSLATNDIYADLWCDTVAPGTFLDFEITNRFNSTAGNDHRSGYASRSKLLFEQDHSMGLLVWVSGGTGTINRAQWQVTVLG